MGGLNVSLTYEGEPVERESRRAFEIVSEELFRILDEIGEVEQIVPEIERERLRKSSQKLREVASEANRIAERAEYLESLGQSPEDALSAAIPEEAG